MQVGDGRVGNHGNLFILNKMRCDTIKGVYGTSSDINSIFIFLCLYVYAPHSRTQHARVISNRWQRNRAPRSAYN